MARDERSENETRLGRFLDISKAVLLGGILIALGLASAMVGMHVAVRRTEVVVPPMVGKSAEEARQVAAAADLALEVAGERYDDAAARGSIVSQFPEPGWRLKAKRAVQVYISLGPRTNPVPNLIGSTLRVAQLTAGQNHYEIGYLSEISLEGTKKDSVLEQFPPPQSSSAVSPRINLLISKGAPARYIMPDVTGQNLNEVQPYFERRGFKLPSVEYRFYSNVRKGIVVKQFPQPGNLLVEGDTINLEVAR